MVECEICRKEPVAAPYSRHQENGIDNERQRESEEQQKGSE